MDQPAGLQVDYVFRGVEHAVRVVVSGQVLELEVEDRMTADQWRGEFDAGCECLSACPGWAHLSSPGRLEPRPLPLLFDQGSPWGPGKWSGLRGGFSSHPVIEDLTHKTGNFKQFSIFCNMLESALTQVGTWWGVWRGFSPSDSWVGYPLKSAGSSASPFIER